MLDRITLFDPMVENRTPRKSKSFRFPHPRVRKVMQVVAEQGLKTFGGENPLVEDFRRFSRKPFGTVSRPQRIFWRGPGVCPRPAWGLPQAGLEYFPEKVSEHPLERYTQIGGS